MYYSKIIPEHMLPSIYLKPGEAHFGLEPARVVTVLGSCVSVIMYHRLERVGAICHAVMPSSDNARSNKHMEMDAFQYVDNSVEWMTARFREAGIGVSDIEVKLFGGSDIFFNKNSRSSIAIGKNNIETALRIIEHNKLKLKAWNVGGRNGRKLIFYTDTGEIFTRPLDRTIFGSNPPHRE